VRTYDLTPLFRSSVGFDRVTRLFDTALQFERAAKSYPPYNIVKIDENDYRITLAVAGFLPQELELEARDGTLTVRGKTSEDTSSEEFLYRGIASRAFERRFQLADHIRISEARMDNGLLHVDLVREVPDALKPRMIEINTSSPAMISAA
jgi:molecular chaperone IbpA